METLFKLLNESLEAGELSEAAKNEATRVFRTIIDVNTPHAVDAIEYAQILFDEKWKELAELSEKGLIIQINTICSTSRNVAWTVAARDHSVPMCARGLMDDWGY